MPYMFYGLAKRYISIIFSNISSVVDMYYIFSRSSINSIKLTNLNTSSVVNMNHMFSYCQTLGSLSLSDLYFSLVTNMVLCFIIVIFRIFKFT